MCDASELATAANSGARLRSDRAYSEIDLPVCFRDNEHTSHNVNLGLCEIFAESEGEWDPDWLARTGPGPAANSLGDRSERAR